MVVGLSFKAKKGTAGALSVSWGSNVAIDDVFQIFLTAGFRLRIDVFRFDFTAIWSSERPLRSLLPNSPFQPA